MDNFKELPTASTRLGRLRRWAQKRRGWLTLALLLLAVLGVAARAGIGLSQTTALKGRIQPLSGFNYLYVLDEPAFPSNLFFSFRGDTNERPSGSDLHLFEDDKPLRFPHSSHADIVQLGQGRYSHWGSEGLHILFSASDNSNPMTNGRAYEARYRLYLQGPPFGGILLIVVAALILLYLPEARRFGTQVTRDRTPALEPAAEVRKMSPVKTVLFSVISIGVLSVMGIGLTVVTDMVWRLIYKPVGTPLGIDTSFYEYRDYVTTTQPTNLVLGKSKHPAEGYYYAEQNCSLPDGTTARFNSLGFRSPEFLDLPPKQPNEVRIIVTGGSASMSHNVSEACTLDANLISEAVHGSPCRSWSQSSATGSISSQTSSSPSTVSTISRTATTPTRAPYAGWRVSDGYGRLRDWVWGGPLTSFQGIRITHDIPILLDKLSFDFIRRAGATSSLPEFASGNSMATRFEHPADLQKIAQRTDFDPRNRSSVDYYLRNMKMMELAAQTGGIQILHVLQPALYLKQPLSAFERNRMIAYEELVNYTLLGYLRMSSGLKEMTKDSDFARYLDLSAPFQGEADTYFYDYCHLTPKAYEVVASRIADVAADMLKLQR